ncbi:MAG: hypothetical protein K2W82_06000 [Candidatus Obscuribacterales bacterium]|nr:hypothetical protein [Candidatus Obscuribacterales bacterium]
MTTARLSDDKDAKTGLMVLGTVIAVMIFAMIYLSGQPQAPSSSEPVNAPPQSATPSR